MTAATPAGGPSAVRTSSIRVALVTTGDRRRGLSRRLYRGRWPS